MAVAKDPGVRFQTAAAFRNALSSVAAPLAKAVPAAIPAPKEDPPLPAAARSGSRRGLWMALGAGAAALAIAGVIGVAPWKSTKAARPAPPPAVVVPPARQAAQQPADGHLITPPPDTPPQVQPQAPAPKIQAQKAEQPLTARPQRPPESVPQVPTEAQRPPEQVRPQPVAPTPAAQVPAQPPAAAAAPANAAELQSIRVQVAMLGARANAVHSSLATLQRAQAAGGLNLRGDMQQAAGLMDTFLQGAGAALNAGDAASAKDFSQKAETQIERLEKFLNR